MKQLEDTSIQSNPIDLPSSEQQYQSALHWAKDGRKATLSGFDLSQAKLRAVDLAGANLDRANLVGTNLCKANLNGTSLKEANLNRADLGGANLHKANLERANLYRASLFRSNLEGANLCGVNLGGAILCWANLNGVKIDDATQIDNKWQLVWEIVNQGASEQNLDGVDLRGANLNKANLRGANLGGADLSKANLRETDLREANLCGANLYEANLNGADLSETNLIGAKLYDADLNGANLSGARIDDTTQIDDKWLPVWKIFNQDVKGQDLNKTKLGKANLNDDSTKNKELNKVGDPETVIDTLWQKAGIDPALVDNWQPVSGFRMFLLVCVILLIIGLGYIFWVRPVLEQPAPTVMLALAPIATPPTPAPTTTTLPSPTTILPASLPSAGDAVDDLAFTPIPDDGAIIATPMPQMVGWVSSLDKQGHFNDPNIHVGFLKGYIYHGAIQFDLSAIPRNSTITHAALELTGLGDQNLSSGGLWQVRLLDQAIDEVWPVLTYDLLHNAAVDINILPALTSAGLGRDRVNAFPFGPEQLAVLQRRLANGVVSFRLDGPASGNDNFFTWDSGYRNGEEVSTQPVLRIAAVSREFVVITSTPTPENALTAVAMMSPSESVAASRTPTPLPPHWVTPIIVTPQSTPANTVTAMYEADVATAEAVVYGTATPTPLNVWTVTPPPSEYVVITSTPTPKNVLTAVAMMPPQTPTPLPSHWVTPIIIIPHPTPANTATAMYEADVATAEAVVYGTATPTPLNVWTATPLPSGYVVVTSTPTPENVITAAAMAAKATQVTRMVGTYTPIPQNWVTPIIVTAMPKPDNAATVEFQAAVATAQAILYEPGAVVWTATPTPIFVAVEGEVATPWAPYTPTPTPPSIPSELVGKIAFLSNRSGGDEPLAKPLVYMINPDGSNLAVLTDRTFYDLAIKRDSFSPDQRFRVFVKDAFRFDGKRVPTLYFYDYLYNAEEQITRFGAGLAWDPVWSPTREQIAFVSNDSADDEIWVVNRDGSSLLQLTESNEVFNARAIGKDTFIPEVNRHPSWSPDGSKIVFSSTRTGHHQIWIMNIDGSEPYSLSTTNYDDWSPVWIKYTDPPRNPVPVLGPPQVESPPELSQDDNSETLNGDSEP